MGNSNPSQPAVKICLLGDFYLRVGDTKIASRDIPGKKAPALLKLLALQPNYQLVKDQVIDTLWPQLQLKEGAAQLYKAIYHIRKVFHLPEKRGRRAPIVLELSDDLLRLRFGNGIITDVREFEKCAHRSLESKQLPALEQARKLYTGELLPMDLYCKWTVNTRDWLRQLYLSVLLTLIRQYSLKHDFLAASEVAREALATDPLFEDVHQELMKVFAMEHQPIRALIQFNRYKKLLWEELGIEASKEMVWLAEAIQSHRFEPSAE